MSSDTSVGRGMLLLLLPKLRRCLLCPRHPPESWQRRPCINGNTHSTIDAAQPALCTIHPRTRRARGRWRTILAVGGECWPCARRLPRRGDGVAAAPRVPMRGTTNRVFIHCSVLDEPLRRILGSLQAYRVLFGSPRSLRGLLRIGRHSELRACPL